MKESDLSYTGGKKVGIGLVYTGVKMKESRLIYTGGKR